jgi:4-hydroxythreonine-4-phosphate dehydrogenase
MDGRGTNEEAKPNKNFCSFKNKRLKNPIIAISSGDPAGIGPEVLVKALSDKAVYVSANPVAVADSGVLSSAIDSLGLDIKINIIDSPSEGLFVPGTIDLIDLKNVKAGSVTPGIPSESSGRAAFEYVSKVISLAMNKDVEATVTGPISKEAIRMAGYRYAGHTEIFAHFTGTSDYAMMLADGDFRVVHVNTHVSMLEAIKRITSERVFRTIDLTYKALKMMGIKNPRIAVNGLNPHAGENGLFGSEESDHIIPAISKAKDNGINADGPHPPDTIFPKMKGGMYDAVVCMYHDQGHIPVKLLGFRLSRESGKWESVSGVNITLGLPIIRVSVDHGTAFDIAGKGKANCESMIQAIALAAKFSFNS